MIVTVFSTTHEPADHWRSELLEYSWRRVEQPGELLRLVAAPPGAELPGHRHAQILKTLPWDPHPYGGGVRFRGFNLPASLLEWLFNRPIDATALLLDAHSVFFSPVTEETEPGRVLGTPWADLPRHDDGPFRLGPTFAYLDQVCVDRTLELPRVTWPLLIHTRDLIQIAARWLELTLLIRKECEDYRGSHDEAHRIAYSIAAAEYDLAHEARRLGSGIDVEAGDDDLEVDAVEEDARDDGASDDDDGEEETEGSDDETGAPIYCYRSAVESPRGEILWDAGTYEPWQRPQAEQARPGPGRELLALIEEKIALEEAGGELAFLRPKRLDGVREARLLDQILLEIPGLEDCLSLNASAASIWELVDDQRTLGDIALELEREFEMESGSLRADVETTAGKLRDAGALEIARISQ